MFEQIYKQIYVHVSAHTQLQMYNPTVDACILDKISYFCDDGYNINTERKRNEVQWKKITSKFDGDLILTLKQNLDSKSWMFKYFKEGVLISKPRM